MKMGYTHKFGFLIRTNNKIRYFILYQVLLLLFETVVESFNQLTCIIVAYIINNTEYCCIIIY
jgi:hypothetical protein